MKRITFGKSIVTASAIMGMAAFTPALHANDQEGKQGQKHEAHAGKQSPEKFLKEALEANNLEIKAAEMAQQQGQHPQVKQLASALAQYHQQAQQQLQQLAQKHNVQAETELTGKHQQQWTKLQGKTGQELDKAFVTFVVKDHRKDITMMEKCSKEFTSAPELKTFIDRSLPAMRQHLQMAQQTAKQLNIDPAELAADTEQEDDSAIGAPGTTETGRQQQDQQQQNQQDQQQDNQADTEIKIESPERDNNDQP